MNCMQAFSTIYRLVIICTGIHVVQGFIQNFWMGVGNFFGKANVLVGGCGGILFGVHYHVMLGGLGACSPGEFVQNNCLEIAFREFTCTVYVTTPNLC